MTPQDAQQLIHSLIELAGIGAFVLLACVAFLTMRAGR